MPKFQRKRFKRRSRRGLGKVKSQVKFLMKNTEWKYKDQVVGSLDANLASSIQLLNGNSQGSFRDAHIGEELTARRIAIRGVVKNNHGTPQDTTVRLMLVRKLNNNGVAITLPYVLENVASFPTLSWTKMDNARNLRIIWDHTFTMDSTQHSVIPFKLLFKLNHTVKFNSSGSTATNIETNGLYFVMMSQVSGTADNPVVDLDWRYSYCDN